MTGEAEWDFEAHAPFRQMTETGVNLCAYFDAVPQSKMITYSPFMTDEELIAWDGNFTEEGVLFLPCCESENVDPQMYRRYIEACIAYRELVLARSNRELTNRTSRQDR
ncbi:MAG: hypothetical protein AB7P23_03100 [Amphiplicatus sp.]